MFIIDRRPYEIAVDSARAEVARTAATVELNAAELERGATLVKSRNIPEREYDQRKANLNVAPIAIISGGKGTAQEKLQVMEACGIKVTRNPAEMGKLLKSVL